MAIIQAGIAAATKALGRILNTAFGWATVMLFGKVPQDRQVYLSIITFGSVTWILALFGIAFPSFGAWLLTLVRPPRWLQAGWVRLAMLALAVIIPLVVGWLAVKITDRPPKGFGETAKAVLRGYPYTLGLALTLVMLCLFAPVMKVGSILRRWETQHVPVIVEAQDYLPLVKEIEAALAQAGWKTTRRPVSWMLSMPTHVLTALAGGAVKSLVADNLTRLVGKNIEVVLHPSDLIITGPAKTVAHARAALAEQLAFSKAHLTWSKEANTLEDRLQGLWQRTHNGVSDLLGPLDELDQIEAAVRGTELPYEEWESLFRAKLLVERGLLQMGAGIADQAPSPAEAAPAERSSSELAHSAIRREAGILQPAVAAATFAVLAWLGLRGVRPA